VTIKLRDKGQRSWIKYEPLI